MRKLEMQAHSDQIIIGTRNVLLPLWLIFVAATKKICPCLASASVSVELVPHVDDARVKLYTNR